MNAFSAAVNVLFADPNMAISAEYRSGGADPAISVKVIKRAPDQIAEFNAGRLVVDSVFFDVRVSDVATLERGDTFTISGEVHVVQGDPRRDSERLVWMAETRVAT